MKTDRGPGTRQPRVAYLVSMFPCWSETFISEEIQQLVKSGFDVQIFSLKPATEKEVHALSVDLLPLTVYATSLTEIFASQLYFLARAPVAYILRLYQVLKGSGPSATEVVKFFVTFVLAVHFARVMSKRGVNHIHAHWATYSTTAAWIIRALTGIPFSFTTHAHDLYRPDSLLPRKIEGADFVVTISEYNRKILNQIRPTPKKYHVIHCGVDVERFGAIKNFCWEEHRLISVGRLVEIKGFNVLLEACRILKDSGVRFSCEIVGEGPLRVQLDEQIVASGLQEHVRLCGFASQDEVRSKLAQSTLFVLACQQAQTLDRDGIPVALMEPMAMGLPVVSTYVSGVPELIRDNYSGLLVPAGDPSRLAIAITSLLTDQQECLRLGANARAVVVSEFNIVRNAAKLGCLLLHTSEQVSVTAGPTTNTGAE